ncbi:hypothetical protein ES319_A03G116400v1 [Gossypium barbadense]|uniref:Uncharacterized protein n=2 Tax=Gossypium TaxID=3633 RepID=A0A5J5WDH6_GOSBA|nr:hypothetical protein ES319_A03G116400v1 [Gossypium barbadense]TYH24944.1 hypothetical protein ES288_A03G130300v1 [Gossypium darwinii]
MSTLICQRGRKHFLDGHIYCKKNTVGKASDYTRCTLPLISTCEKSQQAWKADPSHSRTWKRS